MSSLLLMVGKVILTLAKKLENLVQLMATEGVGAMGLTRSILKITGRWSELRSLITLTVMGYGSLFEIAKSIIESRVFGILLMCVGTLGA